MTSTKQVPSVPGWTWLVEVIEEWMQCILRNIFWIGRQKAMQNKKVACALCIKTNLCLCEQYFGHCESAADGRTTASDASCKDQQPVCNWKWHKSMCMSKSLSAFSLMSSSPSYILVHCHSAADSKITATDASRKDSQPVCNWHSHAFALFSLKMLTSSSIVVSHGQSAADIKATAADASRQDSQPIFSWQWHIATLLSLSWLVLVSSSSSSTSYILSHCCSAADRKTTAADASREDPQPACRRPDCPLRLWWRRRQQGCWLESCTAAP